MICIEHLSDFRLPSLPIGKPCRTFLLTKPVVSIIFLYQIRILDSSRRIADVKELKLLSTMTRFYPFNEKKILTKLQSPAAVVELADTRDLKSLDGQPSCRFDPGQRHHGNTESVDRPPSLACGYFAFALAGR